MLATRAIALSNAASDVHRRRVIRVGRMGNSYNC